MNLSMSMLAHYLRRFNPECYIPQDTPNIKSLRLLTESNNLSQPDCAYFASARDFFVDNKLKNAYILASQNCRLMFYDCTYDELLNEILLAFDYYDSLEQKLENAASKNASLEEIASIGSEVIDNPFFIADYDTNVLFSCNPDNVLQNNTWNYITTHGHLPSYTMTQELHTTDGNIVTDMSTVPQFLIRDPLEPVYVGMYLNIGGEIVGALCIILEKTQLPFYYLQLANILSGYITAAAEFSSTQAPLKPISILLCDILSGAEITEDIKKRFMKQCFAAPWRLLLFRHSTRTDSPQRRLLQRSLSNLHMNCIPFEYESSTAALVKESNFQEIIHALKPSYDLSLSQIGVSMPFYGIQDLTLGYKQSLFAISRQGNKPGIFICEDFAFDYIIKTIAEHNTANQLLHPVLSVLKQYDNENQTDLYHTLNTFLENDENMVTTAELLHVHKNTIKYRLYRINELAKINLKNKEEKNFIRLSFWIDAH